MDAKKKMPVKKTGRKHFKNYAVLDGVSVTDMTKEQLEAHVYHLQQEIEKEKEERNCFQIDRDRIQSLWEITKQQLEEKDTMLRLKDNEIDEAALSHLAEIKLYKQKMKHIMFECEQLVNEKIVEKMVEKLALEEAYKTQVDCLENDIKKLEGEILQLKTEHSDAISNQKLAQIASVMEKESHLKEKVKNLKIENEGLNEELCKMQQSLQKHQENINKNIHVGSVVRNLQREIRKLKPENYILYSKLQKVESAKKDLEMKFECLSEAMLVNRELVQKNMMTKQSIPKRNKSSNIKALTSESSENNEHCRNEVEGSILTVTALKLS